MNTNEETSSPPQTHRPIHATFTNAKEAELEKKCRELQKMVNIALKHPTEAMKKRQAMSEVITDEETCLVTGKIFPRGMSDIQKLDAHSRSLLSSEQRFVGGLCLICTRDNIERRQQTDPTFDPSNPEQLKECYEYEEIPGANTCSKCTGLAGKAQPLHPNPDHPAQCCSCHKPIVLGGELRLACPHCPYSYVMPAVDAPIRSARNQSEATREFQNKTLQYALTYGGGSSEFLGRTVDVGTAQIKLLTLALSKARGGKEYAITPRMAWYAPLLATASTPEGHDGLGPADFQDFELCLLHTDERLSKFSVDMTPEELGKKVRELYPCSPTWESAGAKSVPFEKLVIKNAVTNEGRFWTSTLGHKWQNDTSKVVSDVFSSLMPGSASSSCTIPRLLHVFILTYHSFTCRIKEQMRDLSVCRMWYCEREAGMCIRLFYSPNLPDILLESTLAMKGQEEKDRAVAFYGSETLDGSVYDEKGRQELQAKKKKESEEKERRFKQKAEEARKAAQAAKDKKAHEDAQAAKNQDGGAPPADDGKGGKGAKGGKSKGSNTGGNNPDIATGNTTGDHYEPTHDPIVMNQEICPPVGQLQGERAIRIAKWQYCIPCDTSGKRYCPMFQTRHGCLEGPTCCADIHEVHENWPPQWQRAFLAAGGAKFWKPLTLDSLKSCMPHQTYPTGFTVEQLHRYALQQLDLLLEEISRPMICKRPMTAIQSGKTDLVSYRLAKTEELPFQLCSTAGAEVSETCHFVLGSPNAMYDILGRDAGDTVILPDGSELHNRCLFVNLAAGSTPSQTDANTKATLMVLDAHERLIDLYQQQHHRLNGVQRELFWRSGFPEQHGYPEHLPDLIKIDQTAGENLMMLCHGAAEDGGLLVLMWPTGDTVKHPIQADKGIGAQRMRDWLYGFAAEHANTRIGMSLPNGQGGKHTWCAELHKEAGKFRNVIEEGVRMVNYAHCPPTFRIVSQGHAAKEGHVKDFLPVSDKQLHEAYLNIKQEYQKLKALGIKSTREMQADKDNQQSCTSATGGAGTPDELTLPDSATSPTTQHPQSVEAESQPVTTSKRPSQDSLFSCQEEDATDNTKGSRVYQGREFNRQPAPHRSDERQPEPMPHTARPDSATGLEKARANAYFKYVADELPKVPKDDLLAMLRAFVELSKLSQEWYLECMERGHEDEWSALQLMVSTVRDHKMGGKARRDTSFIQVHESLKQGIPEHHLLAIEEVMESGFDGAYLGKCSGYKGGSRKIAAEAVLPLLKNYLKLVSQYKVLPHAGRYKDTVKHLLTEGAIFCPVSATEKLSTTKEVVHDDEGVKKMRQLTDGTDLGYADAYNAGAKSYKTARQLTTDKRSVAGTMVREMTDNPGYFLLSKGADVSDAFTNNGRHLRSIGKLGAAMSLSCVEENPFTDPEQQSEFTDLTRWLETLLFSSLALVFGGTDQPGGYEITASAPTLSLLGMKWSEPDTNGAVRPGTPRFVDDHLLIIAQKGHRAAQQERDLDSVLKQWISPSWQNKDKDSPFSAINHGFGFLVNAIRKELSTPWSRIIRLENKLLPYLNEKGAKLTADLTPSVRGLANFVLEQAEGLKPLVLPRLDRILSSIARENGGKPQPDFIPSAAFPGETEDYAHEMLRVTLAMLMRLLRVNQGTLLTQPVEHGLDEWYRMMFPGREKQNNVSFNHGDGSGSGWYMMNNDTGEEIQHFFTHEQKLAFNNFQDKHSSIQIDNVELVPSCIGTPVLAPKLAALKDAEGTPLSMIIELQDNTVAEAGIQSGKTQNAHNWELLLYAGLWSTLTGISHRARRVNTADNWIADPGSRPDLSEELCTAREKWSKMHNRPVTVCDAPEHLLDINDWICPNTEQTPTQRIAKVWKRLEQLLDHYESINCDLISRRIDHTQVREIIRASINDEPLSPSPPFTEDFPEAPPQSAARAKLAPMGKSVKVHTRSTLLRKILNRKIAETGMSGTEIMTQQGDAINTDINSAMAEQYLKRDILWQPNQNYDPTLPIRPSACVNTTPFNLKEPVRFALYQAGQLSWGKAAEDCGGGVVKTASEWQPYLREYAHKVLPSVTTFSDDHLHNAAALTQQGVETSCHGPTCCTHATSNDAPTYNRGTATQDPAGLGLQFQQCCDTVREAHNGFGLAYGIIECVPGAAQRGPNGESSALDELIALNPKFHFQDYLVNSKNVRSPLTKEGGAVHEPRLYVTYHNRAIWKEPPPPITIPKEQVHNSCAEFLDKDSESPGFYVMPTEDVEGFQFKFRKGGEDKSIAFVGKILKPNKGFGEGAFPSEAWDGQMGIAPDATAAQQRWVLRTVAGEAALTHSTNAEMCREYQLRQIPTDLLHPKSEFGRYVIANAVVQPVADYFTTELLYRYLQVEPISGLTYREIYLQKLANHFLASNTTGRRHTGQRKEKVNHYRNSLEFNKRKPSDTQTPSDLHLPVPKKKCRGRPKPSCDEAMMLRIRKNIRHVEKNSKQPDTLSRKDANVRHFADFREAQNLPVTVQNAERPDVQQQLKEYISYEVTIHNNKGSTILGKLGAIDDWHIKNSMPPPFMVAFSAKNFLDDVIAMDVPPCPKVPVPAQLTVLMKLRKMDLRQEADGSPSQRAYHDDTVEVTAATTGLWLLLRSKEYLQPDRKKFVGLIWEDVYFKDSERMELQDSAITVESTAAITFSLLSTKNSFGRCTRTLHCNRNNPACPVALLVHLYQLHIKHTGTPPDPKSPVFSYLDGRVMTRARMSLLLRQYIKACDLDERLFASHSLRRGGCVVYHANSIPLEVIKRFGRWNSDAVLLYIHDTDSTKTKEMASCFDKLPRFELH